MDPAQHRHMHVLRTPDERFDAVDFCTPKYAQITPELRVAWVDEGPRGAAETILLLHGEPTWSHLYRKMVPGLVQAGYSGLPRHRARPHRLRPLGQTEQPGRLHVCAPGAPGGLGG